ncbi:MAG: hypothetical protein Q4A32_06250 [Lachnospiraceae bacterium]|nr:hypothetical protein [Lachnospiraceae bacterium]
MHDFIEKPSRLILFIIGIIALVTIIILLSKSSALNLGGKPLVDANGKLIVTPTAAPPNNTQTENPVADADDEYQEVYIEDDAAGGEADDWEEAEIPDEGEDAEGEDAANGGADDEPPLDNGEQAEPGEGVEDGGYEADGEEETWDEADEE